MRVSGQEREKERERMRERDRGRRSGCRNKRDRGDKERGVRMGRM